MKIPKVSVVFPVKNGEKYISEAIESTLAQTYPDFELLIFDDNSSDNTLAIVRGFQDSRIKIFSSKDGFISNLNRGIEISLGTYIARMDADDIMNPLRLETQVHLMDHSNIDVCGSWLIMFGISIQPYVHGIFEGKVENPIRRLRHGNFMPHPSVMMRKEFFIENNLRYENYPHAEDYKLWFEVAKKNGNFYIEPTPLLAYRLSDDQITSVHQKEIGLQSQLIQKEVNKYLGIED